MDNKSRPKRIKKRSRPTMLTWFILFFTVFFIYFAYTFIEQSSTISSLNQKTQEAEKKLSQLEDEKRKLENELEKVNDLDYIEKIAREKLKMVKPNDIIYDVEDSEGQE